MTQQLDKVVLLRKTLLTAPTRRIPSTPTEGKVPCEWGEALTPCCSSSWLSSDWCCGLRRRVDVVVVFERELVQVRLGMVRESSDVRRDPIGATDAQHIAGPV